MMRREEVIAREFFSYNALDPPRELNLVMKWATPAPMSDVTRTSLPIACAAHALATSRCVATSP
jgi:hypothetical protein